MSEYEFYLTNGYGHIASEKEFISFWRKAACCVDRTTFGRSSSALCDEKVRNDVMHCICAVTECLAEAADVQTGIASENVDGYSVSYRSAEEIRREQEIKIYSICRRYLPAEMLYCGV